MAGRDLGAGHHQDAPERLVERIREGDEAAFAALYDRYARQVFSLALGILREPEVAEDVTQEVFLALWRGAARFDPRRGNLEAWILTLAHHKSVDALRRWKVRQAEPLSDAAAGPDDPVEEAMQALQSAQVRAALAALSPPQREALTLAYYGGLTQRDIARRLALPLGTVKTRMRDGLLRLRALLREAAP
jgi:RNA polymerase sigma-70 factor (ECF subfamily)